MNRRRNPWGLILVPLVLVGTAIAGTLLAVLTLTVHGSMIPDDALLSRWTRLGGILMFVPIFFPAILLGMLFANGVAWCIPPIRRMFDGPPGDPGKNGFARTMKLLLILTGIALAITVPLSLVGARSYFHVTTEGITARSFLAAERTYAWTDARAVDIRCHAEGQNLHLNYRVEMADGSTVDLMQEGPAAFLKAYPEIKSMLETQPGIVVHRRMTPSGKERLERTQLPATVRGIRRLFEPDTGTK